MNGRQHVAQLAQVAGSSFQRIRLWNPCWCTLQTAEVLPKLEQSMKPDVIAPSCFTRVEWKRPLCLIRCQNCTDVCNDIAMFLFLQGVITVIYKQLCFYFSFDKSQSPFQLDAPLWACPELWDTKTYLMVAILSHEFFLDMLSWVWILRKIGVSGAS